MFKEYGAHHILLLHIAHCMHAWNSCEGKPHPACVRCSKLRSVLEQNSLFSGPVKVYLVQSASHGNKDDRPF